MVAVRRLFIEHLLSLIPCCNLSMSPGELAIDLLGFSSQVFVPRSVVGVLVSSRPCTVSWCLSCLVSGLWFLGVF